MVNNWLMLRMILLMQTMSCDFDHCRAVMLERALAFNKIPDWKKLVQNNTYRLGLCFSWTESLNFSGILKLNFLKLKYFPLAIILNFWTNSWNISYLIPNWNNNFLFFFFFFLFFLFLFFFYCSEFCHTLKWISHGFTSVPPPDPPSLSTRSL